MGHTEGRWTQDGVNSDLCIFVGATEFKDVAGLAALASAGAGLLSLNLTAAQAGTFFANVTAFLRRTGMYATPALVDEQYGTAASVPGPTAVANTSGPLAMPGKPPIAGASMATLAGPTVGPGKKGLQLNSIDVIYSNGAVNLSVATVGVTKTKFVDTTAPAVTDIIALGANSLPVAFQATPHVKNVAVASPAMLTDTDAEVIVNVNLTAGAATGTASFYGVNLKCSYNLN